MNEITLKANAKINLTLDVCRKRQDGFHDLKMLMAQIPLCDTLLLKKAESICVTTNLSFLPHNETNIAYRAATAFFTETGIPGGVNIEIAKQIPVSAGLAGGSSDAAAVLQGLNLLYDAKLSLPDLQKIGNRLGKDVPFCLLGGVALAEGTGDILTPLPKLPFCYIVMIKPRHINVSTKEIFTKLRVSQVELHPDTAGAVAAIQNGDLQGLCRRMYNVLEEITAKKYPLIAELKKTMLDCGALGSVMSGSGPSVFGIFDSLEAASFAKERLFSVDPQVFLMKME